jgi:hypothetical protein
MREPCSEYRWAPRSDKLLAEKNYEEKKDPRRRGLMREESSKDRKGFQERGAPKGSSGAILGPPRSLIGARK